MALISDEDIQKVIDQAVSKGLVKSNTADRQKARLNLKIKNKIEQNNNYKKNKYSRVY